MDVAGEEQTKSNRIVEQSKHVVVVHEAVLNCLPHGQHSHIHLPLHQVRVVEMRNNGRPFWKDAISIECWEKVEIWRHFKRQQQDSHSTFNKLLMFKIPLSLCHMDAIYTPPIIPFGRNMTCAFKPCALK